MRHLSTILGIILLSGSLTHAQTKQKLNITAATVFLKGAELAGNTRVNLRKGENEILFTNVSANANAASLMINATKDVVVTSAIFQKNYLNGDPTSPRITALRDSIELLNEQKNATNAKTAVINEQLTVLQGNRQVSGDNTGLSVTELTKLLDLIGSRMEGYYLQKNKLEGMAKNIAERIAMLESQIREEQNKGVVPGGQLLVKFHAEEACNSNITISYVTPDAGWSPIYDIIADNAHSPVKLYYKANVYQRTGVAWDNVKLTLSTGNPNEGVQAPVVMPWNLYFYVPQPVAINTTQRQQLSSEDMKTLATTEISDIASLSPGMYQSQRGKGVSIGGARQSGTLYVIDGVQVQNTGDDAQSSMNKYVEVDNAGVNTTFDISLPYTIPSDGNTHLVAIKKYEMPATYRYYAAPKLDKDVFLQAGITQWESLNLLMGPANIFYDGTYIGRGYMDTRNVKDTMLISLGRDKKIIIKREMDVKKRSVRTIGTNVREAFGYTISIRNTRKEPVQLVLSDQLPISNDKDIVVENTDYGAAELNTTTGILTWNLTLTPNDKNMQYFNYTVKYPKGKTVMGLR